MPAKLRWRIKYGALKEDEAQRLKALRQADCPQARLASAAL